MSELKKVNSEKQLEQYVNKKEFYKVGDQLIPSAQTVISMGIQKGITTEIIEHKKDADGVEVVVRARKGEVFTDEWVRLDYKVEALRLFYQKMLTKIKRGEVTKEDIEIVGYVSSPWGEIPQFKAQWLNIEYQNELLRTFSFLSRIVVTKAKNRAILQLLGYEFREKEEIEHEEQEIHDIASGKLATEAQLRKIYVELQEYAKRTGKDVEEIKEKIKEAYGVEHLADLTKQQASAVIQSLMK